jgi:hypothetical protein
MSTNIDCKQLQNQIETDSNNLILKRKLSLFDGRIKSELPIIEKRIEDKKKLFADSDCSTVLEKIKIGQLSEVIGQFNVVDKKRIEEENKKLVKKRIYYGIGLMLVSAFIIIKISKKNGSNL